MPEETKIEDESILEVFKAFIKTIGDQLESLVTKTDNLDEKVTKLETSIHHPPCDIMLQHITAHEAEKKAKHETDVIRKKFIYNVSTIVLAALIIGAVASVIFAIANGFNPLGK